MTSRAASSDASLPSPSSSLASVTGQAGPMRFVYLDEKGKFRTDPEAVALLKPVKKAIGVVTIWGCPRLEESMILMQTFGKSSAFQAPSTHKSRTNGLWLMSAPMRRKALDGTEYDLLLLDSEGVDRNDQMGTYSMQIFSLAFLLSSTLIYTQTGGIDEAAVDRLCLLTETTKHIRVRAFELGHLSPLFVWLLRDFHLDFVEDDRGITPREHLELALRPVQGTGREIAAKNKIRDSIRSLFPDRECFTLMQPFNNYNNFPQLDQISIDKLRPEFRSGSEALTEFVFGRTRPKQVGATVLTGPVLLAITEFFLEALNNGKVPTIPRRWPIVEEAECRKAYDSAVKFYMSTFDRSKPLEEAAMTEAHEEAVQKSLAAFNESAVDGGSARKKYGELLHRFFRRNFEEYEMNAFGEADMKCSHTIRILKKKLRTACHEPNAGIDNVLKVLGGLCSEYEAASHGQSKWQKLAVFLRESWEGPIEDLGKRLIDQVGCQRSSCMLKCQAIEDQVGLLKKELEASENYKTQYLKRYKDAIRDKTLSDDYSSLQGTCGSLEERSSSLLKTLESAKQESLDWNRKYEQVLSKQKAEEDQTSSEIAILKSQSSAAEARVAAGEEQAQSNLEEAEEWKRKYDIAFREAKAALEKAAIAQERTDKDTPEMEDGLRVEFIEVATKEDELKEKAAQFEYAEQCLTSIKSELKAAESKIEKYDVEIMTLKKEIKALSEKFETTNGKVQIWEMESLRLKEILRDGLQLPIMKDLAARGVWPVSTSVNGA